MNPESPQAVRPLLVGRRGFFWTVLLVSALLRLVLVWQGGQGFFGDENRHDRGVNLYLAVRQGDWSEVRATLARPEHIGFTIIGAAVTGLQHVAAQFSRWGDWDQPVHVIFTMKLGALWLSLFSVANIALVHRLVRVAGGGAGEAGWAAALMASSNVMFYYCRHFLPYDSALTFFLGALLLGWSGRHPLLGGLLAGATYHVYNGYWFLVPVWLALFWWSGSRDSSRGWRGLSVAALGLGFALAAPVALGLGLAGRDYWNYMLGFSRTVTQGLYAEGWSLPFEFLFTAEPVLLPAMLGAIAVAWWRGRRESDAGRRRLLAWLLGWGACYLLLVLLSNGLEKFVVYARTVRPLVALLCCAGGWALWKLIRRPAMTGFALAVLAAVATLGFHPHYLMTFPADVERQILRSVGNPKHSLSVSGSLYIPLALPVSQPELVLVNAQVIYPVRDYIGFPAGQVVLEIAHPLRYRPFQYEGHAPRERGLLRTKDIAMKLIRLRDPAGVPDDLPLPLRFTAADRPTGR